MRRAFRTLDFQPDPRRDMEEEIRTHIALAVEEMVARGWSEADARAEARRRFGNQGEIRGAAVAAARATTRRRKARETLRSVLEDVRFGIRGYLKTPVFTAVAVLTLALGIGALTAIFALVNGFLLKPLPYPDAERLTFIWEVDPEDGSTMTVTPADFRDWQRESRSFSHMAGFNVHSAVLAGDGYDAEELRGSIVTEEFFETLGAGPAVGPGFSPEHFLFGAPGAVIISHELWQRRFGGDPGILGRSVRMDGEPLPVVGIMPAGYRHPDPNVAWMDADFFQPLTVSPEEMQGRRWRWMRVLGRLRADATLQGAQAEMARIAERISEAFPESNAGWGAQVISLREEYFGEARPALLTLLAAGGLVLLIVCVNLANLFLARSHRRQREFAIRAAIGSGRGRIGRQLLVEGILVALVGGGIGLGLNVLLAGSLGAVQDRYFPSMADVSIDLRVVLFTLLVAGSTAVLFSILPARAASRPGLRAFLTEGSPSVGSGLSARRTREALVFLEIALTAVLLFGAALLTRSFVQLVGMPTGFSNRDVLVAELRVPRDHFPDSWTLWDFYRDFQDRVASLPGVERVAFSGDPPFTAWNNYKRVRVEGSQLPVEELPLFEYSLVGPEYFGMLGTPVLSGRPFTEEDRYGNPYVTVVSRSLARELWPGEDPLGKRLETSLRGVEGPVALEVVGVVGDVVDDGLDQAPEPNFYVPFFQEPRTLASILVETRGDATRHLPSIRNELASADDEIPLSFATTLDRLISDSVAVPRAALSVALVFGFLTLTLAGVGVFGVMASSVAERRREMGIRSALGASAPAIAWAVLRRAMALALAATLLGVAGAAALGRVLETLLFGVSARDPLSIILTGIVLPAVALLAAWAPARQATRVDPVVALRPD